MKLSTRLKLGAAWVAGFSGNDVYLLRSVSHRSWIRRALLPGRRVIPLMRLELAPVSAMTNEDVDLAERLIRAYRLTATAADSRRAVSPMWNRNLATKQVRLREVLDRGDARALAELLSQFLRTPVVRGIDTGDLYTGRNWKVHSLKTLDDLVSLAEQVGVVRAESGQGRIGAAFGQGLPRLVEKIEAELGMPIGFPEVGAPYGMRIGSRLVTLSAPEYVYVSWRIGKAIDERLGGTSGLNLMEIGAGYAATAHYLFRMLEDRIGTYTIIDLPEMNALQGYFLGKTLGPDSVALFGEDHAGKRVRVLPPQGLDDHGPVDLVLNENSMPEIPLDAARIYIEWMTRNSRFFYSYNHETLVEGGEFAVITVPELVAEFQSARRLSRNISWVRPGYVEEVYAMRGAPDSAAAAA